MADSLAGEPLARRSFLQATACGAAALVAGVGAATAQDAKDKEKEIPKPETLTLETKDRVGIRCTYYAGMNGKETVPIIMIHDFEGRRTEYDLLAKGLQRVRGHAVIVPDLRGHGDSTVRRGFDGDQQTLSAKDFKPADFAAMVELDLEKVKGFLMKKHNEGELNIELLTVIAAGPMGSVVAVNWVAKDYAAPPTLVTKQGQDVRAMVLLSPAGNYKSLKTAAAFKHPFIGYKLSTMLIGGSKESDIKTIYSLLKRQHAPTPTDEEERARHQDLFYFLEETDLRGTKLLNPRDGLGVDRKILQFIDLRCVAKAADFPWVDRANPLGGK